MTVKTTERKAEAGINNIANEADRLSAQLKHRRLKTRANDLLEMLQEIQSEFQGATEEAQSLESQLCSLEIDSYYQDLIYIPDNVARVNKGISNLIDIIKDIAD